MTMELLDVLGTLGDLRFNDLEPTERPLLLTLVHNVDESKFDDCCDKILIRGLFSRILFEDVVSWDNSSFVWSIRTSDGGLESETDGWLIGNSTMDFNKYKWFCLS